MLFRSPPLALCSQEKENKDSPLAAEVCKLEAKGCLLLDLYRRLFEGMFMVRRTDSVPEIRACCTINDHKSAVILANVYARENNHATALILYNEVCCAIASSSSIGSIRAAVALR